MATTVPFVAPFITRGRHTVFGDTLFAQDFSARAIRLVEEATVMDMLCPLSIAGDYTEKWMMSPARMSCASRTTKLVNLIISVVYSDIRRLVKL
jgi:hypothetical protein|tara:strand:- start:2089 stop:2370 length:282 start_codon:yes stop_codon:yes gene_type:complete